MTTDVYNIAPFNAPRLARLILAVVFLLTPWVEAQALGLGEVSVSSAINEPLDADIELLNLQGLEESELIVSLGSAADYNLAGVRYNFFHAELEFEPDFSNPARPRVSITSGRPVTEPYLNFVVQARWPSGRLLREYTVLLDLPVFSGEQTSSSASAPAASNVQTPGPQQSQPVNVTPSPAASAPPTPSGSYRVQFGDTLWEIAERVASETGITHAQAMLSLRDLNPAAFFDGNMNRIMSGSLLRIPTPDQVTVRDPAAARAQVASELGLADSTPLLSTNDSTASSSSSTDGGQFRLATSGNETLAASASQGVSNASLAQVEAENSVLKEELDAVVVENDDLRERLAQLEEQIAVLERLVEVENADLAQAQNLSEPQPAPVAVTPPPAPQPSLMDRLMGWIPWIGIALVGLLVAAYMVLKRRGSSDTDLDMSDDMEDQLGEEVEEAQDDDMDGFDDPDDDDFDADATVVLGASPDASEVTDSEDSSEDDDFALPEDDDEQPVVTADEDDDTDFDDLDAFFSDIDDKGDVGDDDDFDDALIQDEEAEAAEDAADPEDPEAVDLADETVDEIEAGLDEDMAFDIDEDGDEPQSAAPDEAISSADEEGGVDFDLGDVDMATDKSESGEDKAEPAQSNDENAMDFDLGEEDMSAEEPESSEKSAPAKDNDENAMDFDLGDVDLNTEAEPESDIEAGAEADDGNAMDFEPSAGGSESDDEGTDDETSSVADEPVEADEEPGEDTDDLDDSIFADLGDEDLDDLLGPEGDEEDPGAAFSSDTESALEEEDSLSASTSDEEEEDLSSLTAMLDNGALDAGEAEEESTDESEDDDLGFDLDLDADGEGESNAEDTLAFDTTEGNESDAGAECDTKLELAEAYVDMGDESGAKTLLKEVLGEGSDDQKAKAQELLDKIS